MRVRYGYLTLIFTFILGCHDGFVALWTDPCREAPVVFPYSTASLPPADRARLMNGIRLETQEELARLLEDYLS